jgi:hypothetical protein
VERQAFAESADATDRVRELKARVTILSATCFRQFLPSLEPGGFNDPNF